jgi:hypothetical protein
VFSFIFAAPAMDQDVCPFREIDRLLVVSIPALTTRPLPGKNLCEEDSPRGKKHLSKVARQSLNWHFRPTAASAGKTKPWFSRRLWADTGTLRVNSMNSGKILLVLLLRVSSPAVVPEGQSFGIKIEWPGVSLRRFWFPIGCLLFVWLQNEKGPPRNRERTLKVTP